MFICMNIKIQTQEMFFLFIIGLKLPAVCVTSHVASWCRTKS